MLVDAILRNGKAHSNHGNHVSRTIGELVRYIRSAYAADVPIIVVADTGFFDQKLFELCDRLDVGFIVGGKLYKDITTYVEQVPKEQFAEYRKERNVWQYCEFGDRRASWNRFRRAIFTKPITDDEGQALFSFARPETLIYTNLGTNAVVTAGLAAVLGSTEAATNPELVINAYHLRARDELVNRAFKEFGGEHLPFKRFAANAAYYYLMAIAFFLFESFKRDMDTPLVPITWYPTTFRRRCVDIAGKVTRSGGRIVLKITVAAEAAIGFFALWQRTATVIPIAPPGAT